MDNNLTAGKGISGSRICKQESQRLAKSSSSFSVVIFSTITFSRFFSKKQNAVTVQENNIDFATENLLMVCNGCKKYMIRENDTRL